MPAPGGAWRDLPREPQARGGPAGLPDEPPPRPESAPRPDRAGRGPDLDGAPRGGGAPARCGQGGVPEAERLDLLISCLSNRGDQEGVAKALDAGLAASPDHPGLNLRRGPARPDRGAGRPRPRPARPGPRRRPVQRPGVLPTLAGPRPARPAEEAERDRARFQGLNRDLAEMSTLNDEADRKPEDPDVRYRIGTLCERLGKRDLAATWYSAALACDPDHAGALAALPALRRAGGRIPVSHSGLGASRGGLSFALRRMVNGRSLIRSEGWPGQLVGAVR